MGSNESKTEDGLGNEVVLANRGTFGETHDYQKAVMIATIPPSQKVLVVERDPAPVLVPVMPAPTLPAPEPIEVLIVPEDAAPVIAQVVQVPVIQPVPEEPVVMIPVIQPIPEEPVVVQVIPVPEEPVVQVPVVQAVIGTPSVEVQVPPVIATPAVLNPFDVYVPHGYTEAVVINYHGKDYTVEAEDGGMMYTRGVVMPQAASYAGYDPRYPAYPMQNNGYQQHQGPITHNGGYPPQQYYPTHSGGYLQH